jgi:hypothetical protein
MRRMMMVKSGGGGGGGGSDFRALTINHTKCGSADSIDFPVWVSGTYPELADVGHGGQLTSVPNFAFYADSAKTTLLKAERISHDLTTGRIRYWVKVPTVSHSSDTVIYPGWDTSNSTDLMDPANVWTSSFKPVIHTGDGSTLNLNDSTASAQHFTNNGSIAATTGTLYGAANIAGASQQYASSAVAAATDYPLTMSAWVKLASGLSSSEERIILAVAKESALVEFWLSWYNNGSAVGIRAVAQNSGSVLHSYPSATDDTNWHLIHGVFIDLNTLKVYKDGVDLAAGSSGPSTNMTGSGLDHTYIGGLIYNTSNFYGQMKGLVEEPRIASVVRSTSWIVSEYNNQSSPSTFYTWT